MPDMTEWWVEEAEVMAHCLEASSKILLCGNEDIAPAVSTPADSSDVWDLVATAFHYGPQKVTLGVG